jgi:Leucine-rich repeat (LRR) protein
MPLKQKVTISISSSLYCPPANPHNKHSNIQYQFFSILSLHQTLTTNSLTFIISSSLYSPPSDTHNKNSNIQYQLLSLQITAAHHTIKTDCGVGVAAVVEPAVTFWLWLVILPARVAILCPEEYRCDLGRYHVTFVKPSSTTVPLIRLRYMRLLGLYTNNITLFETDCFVSKGLTEVEKLIVEWCELRKTESGAFSGLTKLTKLTLQCNELSEITPGTFENLNNLERLVFDNRLEHLDKDAFIGLVKLKYIDLKENKLKYFHPDMWLGLVS